MMISDKLGLEEFSNELLDRVSKKIVSRNYLNNNIGFTDAFLFDLFQQYLYNDYSIQSLSDITESFFCNMFCFKPGSTNLEEIISI